MERHLRSAASAAAAAIAALLLASCLGGKGDPAALIGDDAAFAVYLESPAAAAAAAQDFYKAAGLPALAGAKDLPSLIRSLDEDASSEDRVGRFLSWIDPSKPLAVAFDRAPAGSSQPFGSFVAWIPLSKAKGAWEGIAESASGAGFKASRVGSYAAVASGREAPAAFPAAKADLSCLEGVPSRAVKLWINPRAVDEAAALGLGKALADADSTSVGAIRIAGVLLAFLEDATGLGLAFEASGDALAISYAASFREGSDAAVAAAANPAKKDLPYLKHVEADAFMGACSSFDASGFAQGKWGEIYDALAYGPLYGPSYARMARLLVSSAGRDSAFSLDFDFDAAAWKDLIAAGKEGKAQDSGGKDSGESLSALTRAVSRTKLGLGWVSAVKDAEAHRRALYLTGDADFLGPALKEPLREAGVSFGFEKSGEAGLSHDVFSVSFDPEALDPEGSLGQEGRGLLSSLEDFLAVRTAYSKGKAFGLSGTAEELSALVSRDRAERPASEDKRIARLLSAVPERKNAFFFMSLRPVWEMIRDFGGSAAPAFDDEFVYGYFGAYGRSLRFGVHVDAAACRKILLMARDAAAAEGEEKQ